MACSLGVWAPCQLTPQTCQNWIRQSSCGFIHQCGESWPGCRKFQAVQYPIFRQTIDKPKLFKLIVKPAWKPSLAMSLPTAYGADPPPNIRDVWKGNLPKQVCENWRGLLGAHPVWSVLSCFVPEMDCQWMAFGFQLLDLNSCTAAGYQTQGTTARSWTHTSNCYRAVVITSTFDSAKYPSRMLTAYVLSLLQEPRSLLQWIEVSLVQSIAAQIYEYVTVNNFCISQLRKYARLCRLIADVNWSMILSS